MMHVAFRSCLSGAVALCGLLLAATPAPAESLIATIGHGPTPDMAANSTTNRLYSLHPNSISVADGDTLEDIASISLASGGSFERLAVNPTSNRIYAAAWDKVCVLDGASNTLIKTIPFAEANYNPVAIAVNPITNRAYVCVGSYSTSRLAVIDGGTDAVVGSVPLPGTGTREVAVNTVTNTVYVANVAAGVLSVISGATNTLIKTIPYQSPGSVASDPATNTVYVRYYDDGYRVALLDGATNTQVSTYPLPNGTSRFLLDSTRHRLCVSAGSTIYVIDPTSGQVTSEVPTPTEMNVTWSCLNSENGRFYAVDAWEDRLLSVDLLTQSAATSARGYNQMTTALTVSPLNGRLYAASLSGDVMVIDGANLATLARITGGGNGSGRGIIAHPTRDRLYVTHRYSVSPAVRVIDTLANSVVTTIPLPGRSEPGGIVFDQTGDMLYTVNGGYEIEGSESVSRISTSSDTLVSTSGVPGYGLAAALAAVANPSTGRFYVAEPSRIIVMDSRTARPTKTIYGLSGLLGLAINERTSRLFGASGSTQSVAVVDTATDTLQPSIPLPDGAAPNAVAVNPVTNRIYTSNSNDTVTVIDGATNAVLQTVLLPPGTGPGVIAVDSSTGRVYVSSGVSTIAVIQGPASALPAYTFEDVRHALCFAAGIAKPDAAAAERLGAEPDVVGTAVDVSDAVRLMRKVVGVEPNP